MGKSQIMAIVLRYQIASFLKKVHAQQNKLSI